MVWVLVLKLIMIYITIDGSYDGFPTLEIYVNNNLIYEDLEDTPISLFGDLDNDFTDGIMNLDNQNQPLYL